MVDSDLKKFAAENGLTVNRGVVYGNLHGYSVTLSGGYGYICMAIAAYLPDETKRDFIMQILRKKENQRAFIFTGLDVTTEQISITFYRGIGYMKRINSFVGWFFKLLPQFCPRGIKVCPKCGQEVTDGKWVLVNDAAFFLHDSCVNRLRNAVEENSGKNAFTSYMRGFAGALLGAIIGAVIWNVILRTVLALSVIFGVVIGFLTDAGYEFFHGRHGKGKMLILILAIVIGVFLSSLIFDRELFIDNAVRSVMGILMAILGAITFSLQKKREFLGDKIKEL